MYEKSRKEFLNDKLKGFTGTEHYYRHPSGRLLVTDGIMYLMQETGCVWLPDLIASFQVPAIDKACDGFQLWTLKGDPAMLEVTCRADSDTPVLVKGYVVDSDFPLDELKLYVEGIGPDRVLLLPSEH